MAEVAGTLVDTVLRRVRDPGGTAHSRAFTRELLSDLQRHVNGATRAVLTTATLTLNPRQQLYSISGLLTDCLRVEYVRDAGRDVPPVPWRTLGRADRLWTRKVGSTPEAWATIGRDLLVITPGMDETRTVTVVYTTLTTALAADQDATELPDQRLPAVLDLAEAILLLRHRLLSVAPSAASRLKTTLPTRSIT